MCKCSLDIVHVCIQAYVHVSMSSLLFVQYKLVTMYMQPSCYSCMWASCPVYTLTIRTEDSQGKPVHSRTK